MSSQDVPLRRKMRLPQPVQPSLVLGGEPEAEDQRRRWLTLTRITLPGLAVVHGWPIRLDHCFMRVLLDNTVGDAWHRHIARPAIRHIAPDRLDRAIALAERVVREPHLLPELNRRSLVWRRHRPV